jgi:hypothetical protein
MPSDVLVRRHHGHGSYHHQHQDCIASQFASHRPGRPLLTSLEARSSASLSTFPLPPSPTRGCFRGGAMREKDLRPPWDEQALFIQRAHTRPPLASDQIQREVERRHHLRHARDFFLFKSSSKWFESSLRNSTNRRRPADRAARLAAPGVTCHLDLDGHLRLPLFLAAAAAAGAFYSPCL